MIALPNDAETDSETRGYHLPVLLREVLDYLRPGPDEIFLDCTIGGGGPARAFLEAGGEDIGVDQDPDAVAESMASPADLGTRLTLIPFNFVGIAPPLPENGVAGF